MCITNPLKISDFQGNLLHMLLFLQKHAFYFSILRIKEGLSHVQQPPVFEIKKSAGLCARYLTYKITVALTNSTLYFAKSTFSEVLYDAFFIPSGSPGVRCQNAETLKR